MEPMTREIIEQAARRALKPRLFEPVWKWAERHVRLSVRTTNTPGRYDSGWIAYSRGWQEAFSNPRVREIVICSAAQSGKTESVLNMLRFAISEDPGPMLWIMPAESLARSFSETRLQPSLRDCLPTAEQIPDDPDLFKLLEMHYRDCTLNLVGANSRAQLSSRPVRYLFADEIDKFPEQSTKEAGALELARVRTTSFWNSKTVLCSTPTVETGQIWQAYLAGNQQRYFVPCPSCGHEQELLFAQLKWPTNDETKPGGVWNADAVEKAAYYECRHCGVPIQQHQKQAMIRVGHWQATNPDAPRDRVSFHLSALYSPWRSWGSVAREFLEAKESFGGLQNFTNSVLAEPWKIKIDGEAISESRLHDLRADYDLGLCPVKPITLTVADDVQREVIYYTVRAWGANEESWLIDYGKLPTLESLTELGPYPIAGTDETASIARGLIDSGFNTQAVYEFCSASMRKFFPCKGWDRLGQPVKEAVIDYQPGRNILLYHFDDSVFKGELYIRRIQDGEGPKWHLPRNVEPVFVSQLTAEKLVDKTNHRGHVVQVWHRIRDNHYGDAEKMQLVHGYLMARRLRDAAKPPSPQPRRFAMGQSWVNRWRR
jgi:phage terminase large subunit GpA-like protein